MKKLNNILFLSILFILVFSFTKTLAIQKGSDTVISIQPTAGPINIIGSFLEI